MTDQITLMKGLIKKLDEAGRAYHQEDLEIMSNFEYDKLYDKLLVMEKETGMVLSGSPSISVGYEAVNELPKEKHESAMLSLDKTKELSGLKSWIGEQRAVLSWKLDGLTIVLTYREGLLYKAVTRGNGEVGEVITNNARVFKNIPHTISHSGDLILRGEAVIRYSDFNRINEQIEDVDARYKNPRNLCSGSVRQLNNEITAERNINFFAFSLVKSEGVDFQNSRAEQLLWLRALGFEIVEFELVDAGNLEEQVTEFAGRITENDFPSDGLVLLLDDMEYGISLGTTAKFPRDSIAYKWADEVKETELLEIEWSPSRTGLINPVAIFVPVELEGSTVSRASVHNISILKSLELGIGDRIEVYKANMIIPQIADNLTRSGALEIPDTCPVCQGATELRQTGDVQSLYCTNKECQAKKIKSFTLFVSRNAMNIDGLSEATLEKFIDRGFIRDFGDIFEIGKYREEIVAMEGLGEKSYENLMDSIEKARTTTLPRVIFSLGISNIGVANAKMICREFHYDLDKLRHAGLEELSDIDGVGPVIAEIFVRYFEDETNNRNLDHLMSYLILEEEPPSAEEQIFLGRNFVITGSVVHFANRNELKALIEARGGKVTGSVTAKTTYLINNDKKSNSSKNKKAKELDIPILSEEDFNELMKEG